MPLGNLVKQFLLLRNWLLLLAILPGVVCAQQQQLLLLLSSDASYYQQTANQIEVTLQQHSAVALQITTASLNELKSSPSLIPASGLVVTIGSDAARFIATQATNTPVLNTLIPMAVSNEVSGQYPDIRKWASITIEQPPWRVAGLALALPVQVRHVGIVTSEQRPHLSPRFVEYMKAADVTLDHRTIGEQQKPIHVLRPLFANSDVFVALPDSGIFNQAMARWVLSLSFQQKVPVVGFSQAYTNAGALASVFSTPENIGTHAAEVIEQWLSRGNLPEQQNLYPKYFTVATNKIVARAMGVSSQKVDEQKLHQLLQAMEPAQ